MTSTDDLVREGRGRVLHDGGVSAFQFARIPIPEKLSVEPELLDSCVSVEQELRDLRAAARERRSRPDSTATQMPD